MRVKITTPVEDHNGAVGNVLITQGVGYADTEVHAGEIEYCRANGYTVTELDDAGDEVPERSAAELAAPAEPAEATDEASDESADQMPRRNASTEAWRAYAIDSGMPAAEADSLTRDQLVERFTSTEETDS